MTHYVKLKTKFLKGSRDLISTVSLENELLFVVSEYFSTQNPYKTWFDHVTLGKVGRKPDYP